MTVDSMRSTNAIIENEVSSFRSNPIAYGLRFNCRSTNDARLKHSLQSTPTPSWPWHSTEQWEQISGFAIRISRGANLAKRVKAIENASPRRNHTSLPKKNIPAHVINE